MPRKTSKLLIFMMSPGKYHNGSLKKLIKIMIVNILGKEAGLEGQYNCKGGYGL